MIYHAMKVISEIDSGLFNDCTQDYEIAQAMIEDRAKAQKEKWKKLEEMAKAHRLASAPMASSGQSGAVSEAVAN